MTGDGEQLIFVISQPRAGSTLLQQMLSSHPSIMTMSEPWLMLHPFYALREQGYEAEYNAELARVAIESFLQKLPGKEEQYYEGVRRMFGYLYGEALKRSSKRYFLDKTPRYYFIIDELRRTFPNAKIILLIRNPLAVLQSIVATWVKGYTLALREWRHDLMQAPRLICAALRNESGNQIAIHYEELVESPEKELRRLCEFLCLEFDERMINYALYQTEIWRYGDRSVYEKKGPDPTGKDKWIGQLEQAQFWRWAWEYLDALGPQIMRQLGYSASEMLNCLEVRRPQRSRLFSTIPLLSLLGPGATQIAFQIRLRASLQDRGIGGTLRTVLRKVMPIR